MFNNYQAQNTRGWQEQAADLESDRQFKEEQEEQEAYIRNRSADNWPEALRKQANLYSAELQHWTAELEAEFPDDYFRPGKVACERALVLWTEVEEKSQDRIKKLELEIQAIKDGIRAEVGQQLKTESDAHGWQQVADDMISSKTDLENWLNW